MDDLMLKAAWALERVFDVGEVLADNDAAPAIAPGEITRERLDYWYAWLAEACDIALDSVTGRDDADIGGEG